MEITDSFLTLLQNFVPVLRFRRKAGGRPGRGLGAVGVAVAGRGVLQEAAGLG